MEEGGARGPGLPRRGRRIRGTRATGREAYRWSTRDAEVGVRSVRGRLFILDTITFDSHGFGKPGLSFDIRLCVEPHARRGKYRVSVTVATFGVAGV